MANMVSAITHQIQVSVEVYYQPDQTSEVRGDYVFAYRITIENKSDVAVQLLRRHWHIYDAIGIWREVEGEGVVGEQPVIHPGGKHQYVSGCHLTSPAGKMFGTYLLERKSDAFLFEVAIPEFTMTAPFIMN
jgi:ApaG protein